MQQAWPSHSHYCKPFGGGGKNQTLEGGRGGEETWAPTALCNQVSLRQAVGWAPPPSLPCTAGLTRSPRFLHSTAVFDREQHTLNLPAVNSITYVLRFLEKLCHNLRSDNLFGSQPFTQTHLPLTTTEYSHSHSHDRYLPGRSWDGAWAEKGAQGSQQRQWGPGAGPHTLQPGTYSLDSWISAPYLCRRRSQGLLGLLPSLLSPGFCFLSLGLTFCLLDFYP